MVLSKIVRIDAPATNTWRELCGACSERQAIVSGLLAYFEAHTIAPEDQPLVRQIKETREAVISVQASWESYLEPKKVGKFETVQSDFGALADRLIHAMNAYPYIGKKPEYLTAISALNICESRLEDKVVRHNFMAGTCNKLIVSFPGPLVATMMRFSLKAVIKKELTKVKVRTTAKEPVIEKDIKPSGETHA